MTTAGLVLALCIGAPRNVVAGQSYTFLLAPFTQDIVGITPSFLGGVAFAPDGDVWVTECSGGGGPLHRYDIQGVGPIINTTPLRPETIVPSNAGCGLANHPDGFLYSNSYSGVVQINASTGAPTGLIFGAGGNALGIAVNPANNQVVYVGGDSTILTAPVGGASSIFSTVTSGNFVDGIFFGPDGKLYAANRVPTYRVTVLNANGTLNRHIALPSEPDGIAFHVSGGFLITMNLDGTISKVDVSNADAISTFASGGGRNDMSAVGPDGCVYTTQDNFTRFDNGVTSSDSSVVRICPGFNPPLCGNGTVDPQEPCDLSSPTGAFTCGPNEVCSGNCICEPIVVCGDGIVAGNEDCDPPGSITCPAGSPGGAFLPCNVDCTCPTPPECTADGDCNDQDTCTADTCVNGGCVYTPLVNLPPEQPGGNYGPDACVDMEDNDCDGLVDCADPDCGGGGSPVCHDGTENKESCVSEAQQLACQNGGGTCTCAPIVKDPSTIRFSEPLDIFKSHGRIVSVESIDVGASPIGWVLSNHSGAFYRGVLKPGDLESNGTGTTFQYKDPGAKLGLGKRDGIYKAKIRISRGGTSYGYKIIAYGDLSAATTPDMALQFYIGQPVKAFIHDKPWIQKSWGWKASPLDEQ